MPRPQNRNIDQKMTLITRDQATELDSWRDIKQSGLLHQREIGLGRGDCIFLRRCLGIERAKRARDRPPTVESDADFELSGIGVRASPEELVALPERLFHQIERRLAFGAILLQRLIDEQRSRRHSFEFGLLRRKKGVGVPDQGAKDQRKQQREEADDAEDHILRTAR